MASSGAPVNDPLFFLHHANVDRLWAMWQDKNRASAGTAANYGNPEYPDNWLGSIFNFAWDGAAWVGIQLASGAWVRRAMELTKLGVVL